MAKIHHNRTSGAREDLQVQACAITCCACSPAAARLDRPGRCGISARFAKPISKDSYDLEVIDIYQEPGRATESDIIAAPTLIKEEPLPMKRLIGDLSDRPKVLLSLAIAGEVRAYGRSEG